MGALIAPEKVRNVGILGHGGVGKTTLVERLLHAAGVTNRVGRVEDGNTVTDYLDEERARKQTICLKLAHLTWKDHTVHLVDHPGYADFVGEVASSAPILDAAVIVVDAAAGPQVGTDNAWEYLEKHKTARAFFVNRLDREHTDFSEAVRQIQEIYGKQCVAITAPVGAGPSLKSVVSLVDGDIAALGEEGRALREALVESVAETDDALTEKFLETGTLSAEDFHRGLHAGILQGKIIPILAGAASSGLGITELLDFIVHSFPRPTDRTFVARDPSGREITLKVSPDEPFVAQVFRSLVDPYVGHLTYFRVITGTLHSDSEVYNATRRTKERTGKIYLINGKEQKVVEAVGPGDLAALAKLKNTHFGDVLTAGQELTLPPIEMPESLVKLAIVPKTRADEDKIGEALNRLAEEDPTFKHYRDNATGEHVICGVGDLQLEILLDRLKNKFRVEAETSTPKVAYRETIKGKAEAQGKYKKQTGGHGQYGDVHLRVSPNERGAGYVFIDSIVGGVVPKQYIPAVDKGCQEALARGVISGHPVVDIIVELFYGSYHEVDSSELAFKIAASLAIQEAVRKARPTILEPIMEITVTVPEEYMGDITGDLNSRRGRILGMDALSGHRQRIRAYVPEAEILRYAASLRSITGGRGTYTLKFSHYDEVPEHIAKTIIAQYEQTKAAAAS